MASSPTRSGPTILLALSDGLAAHVLGGYLSPADAVSELNVSLDHLLERS